MNLLAIHAAEYAWQCLAPLRWYLHTTLDAVECHLNAWRGSKRRKPHALLRDRLFALDHLQLLCTVKRVHQITALFLTVSVPSDAPAFGASLSQRHAHTPGALSSWSAW